MMPELSHMPGQPLELSQYMLQHHRIKFDETMFLRSEFFVKELVCMHEHIHDVLLGWIWCSNQVSNLETLHSP